MKRVAGVLAVVALLAAACGSSKDKDAADKAKAPSTTTTTSESDPAAAGATSTSAPSGTATGTNASGSGKGATATTAKAGSNGSTATTAKAGTSSTAPKPAAPGKYVYDRKGTSHVDVFGDSSLDGQVTLTIDPPTGTDQHTSTSASEGTTEQILRGLDEGAYLVMTKQSTSGLNKEFRPNPPVLAFPSSPTVGRTWSWTTTSTDGKTRLDATFKVERNETLTIGGESVPTVVLSIVLKGSGDITFTTNSTNWVSQAKSLIVRTDSVTDGQINQAKFHQQSTQTLRSTRPS